MESSRSKFAVGSNREDIWLLVDAARQESDDDLRDNLVWAIAQQRRDQRVAVIKQLMVGDDCEDKALAADVIATTPNFGGPEGRSWAREQELAAADVDPFTSSDREWLTAVLLQNLEQSQDPNLVYALIQAVGKHELVEAMHGVIDHTTDADDDVRRVCAVALGQLRNDQPPPDVVRALLSLARDPADDVCDWALFALGQGGGAPIDLPEVRAVFAENVTHPDKDVRAEAVRALAQLGDVEMLEQALSNYELDLDLVETAGRVGDQRLRKPLLELLAEESRSGSSDPETSQHVRKTLLSALNACQ